MERISIDMLNKVTNKRRIIDEQEPTPQEIKDAELERQARLPPHQYIYERIFNNLYILYQDCQLKDFGTDGERALNFLEQGHGLYIFGGVGVGKTRLALSCLKWQLERTRVGFIWTVDDLLDRLRRFIAEKDDHGLDLAIKNYMDLDMLVIDDLGVQASTGWADEKLYEVINQRWLKRDTLQTIVTSNYTPDELIKRCKDEVVGQRIVSRISGMCKRIQLKGEDKRLSREAK